MDNNEYLDLLTKKESNDLLLKCSLTLLTFVGLYAVYQKYCNVIQFNHIVSKDRKIDNLTRAVAMHKKEADNQAYEKSQVDEQLRNTEAKYTQLQKEHEAVKKS